MRCAVFGCNSDNQAKAFAKDVMFFRFPKNKNICLIWKNACGRSDKFSPETSRVCSLHFNDLSYDRTLKHELLHIKPTKLKSDAVPILNLPKINLDLNESARSERVVRRGEVKKKASYKQVNLETNLQKIIEDK